MNELSEIPQMKGYWTLTTEGVVDGQKVMCIVGEFSFEQGGKKSKKKKSG